MKSKSPTRKRTERIQDSNKMPSLALHLQTFATAVADGHPAIEAVVIAGRSRGSASYMKQRAGVAVRIAEFQRIKQIANEKAVAENSSSVIPIVTLTRNHIINGLPSPPRTKQMSIPALALFATICGMVFSSKWKTHRCDPVVFVGVKLGGSNLHTSANSET